jgi:hypothetical protein
MKDEEMKSNYVEIIPPHFQVENNRLVQAAGMLCRNPKFQGWLIKSGCANELNEESAANALRKLLCIDSRRQIGEEEQTADYFMRIKKMFEKGHLLGERCDDNKQ